MQQISWELLHHFAITLTLTLTDDYGNNDNVDSSVDNVNDNNDNDDVTDNNHIDNDDIDKDSDNNQPRFQGIFSAEEKADGKRPWHRLTT